MKQIRIQNITNLAFQDMKASFCSSFFCRFKGLMFLPGLGEFEGLLLVEDNESRINSAIHMFFMRFDIAVIWINSQLQVVDVKIARKGHPFYLPAAPSKYTLETHPDRFFDFRIGDILSFNDK
jgi:uncharacterized membrane protein (UPF0127 family)